MKKSHRKSRIEKDRTRTGLTIINNITNFNPEKIPILFLIPILIFFFLFVETNNVKIFGLLENYVRNIPTTPSD